MALIVENGTGLANSDAYLSVADADLYLASIGNPGDWSSQAAGDKEIAIRRATEFIDNEWRGRWKGQKATAEQALSWPRALVVDEENYAVPNNEIPERLKRATAEAAWRFLEEDLHADLENGGAPVSSTMDKVGPLATSVSYAGGAILGEKLLRKIDALLEGYIGGGNMMQRA